MKRRLPAVLFVLHVVVLLLIILLASYELAHAQTTATKLQPGGAANAKTKILSAHSPQDTGV